MPRDFFVHGLSYIIRQAAVSDAAELSRLRLKADGETEYLDREPGEAFIDEDGFKRLIAEDAKKPGNLCLVAETENGVAGFSRCEGSILKRFAHKTEFGVMVLQTYWGHGIGTNLLLESIRWADAAGLKKMTLYVEENNCKAQSIYQKAGFEREGILKNDKRRSDGTFSHTVMMGRWADERH